MFASTEDLLVVDVIDREGTSKEGKPYHLQQLKLSDGLESFPFSFECVLPVLKRKDKVSVTIGFKQYSNKLQPYITNVVKK